MFKMSCVWWPNRDNYLFNFDYSKQTKIFHVCSCVFIRNYANFFLRESRRDRSVST
jgi:hypothetical protein